MEKQMSEALMIQFRNRLAEDERSKATIQKYMRDLEAFRRFIGKSQITKEQVISYKRYLQERYRPASVNSMLAAVNRFLKEMGWYDCVVKALKLQHAAFRSRERELTKQEYYRLLRAAREQNDERLCLLMETICATGIRVSELRFITVEAVQKSRAVVSLKGKTRTVLLPGELCRELRTYIRKKRIRSGSIFITRSGRPMERNNILHSMKRLCESAKVERSKVFPHNLRHLFACLYYKAQKDLSRLADILGHSNINTTRIYTRVSGEEQLRQIEGLGLILSEKRTA